MKNIDSRVRYITDTKFRSLKEFDGFIKTQINHDTIKWLNKIISAIKTVSDSDLIIVKKSFLELELELKHQNLFNEITLVLMGSDIIKFYTNRTFHFDPIPTISAASIKSIMEVIFLKIVTLFGAGRNISKNTLFIYLEKRLNDLISVDKKRTILRKNINDLKKELFLLKEKINEETNVNSFRNRTIAHNEYNPWNPQKIMFSPELHSEIYSFLVKYNDTFSEKKWKQLQEVYLKELCTIQFLLDNYKNIESKD